MLGVQRPMVYPSSKAGAGVDSASSGLKGKIFICQQDNTLRDIG